MANREFRQVLVSAHARVSAPPKTLKINKRPGAVNRGNTVESFLQIIYYHKTGANQRGK